MKNSKILLIGASLILGSCSLIGCGGGNEGDGTLTINFWHTYGQQIARTLDSLCNRFEQIVLEEEGIEINVNASNHGNYDDLATQVLNSFATGTQPDITVAYPDNVATFMQTETNKGDYVVRLDEYMNSTEYGLGVADAYDSNGGGLSDIVPSFLEEGQHYKYEGTYSMPYMKSTEMMLYNANVVNQVLADMGSEFTGGVSSEVFMSDITWEEFWTMVNYINDNRAKYYIDASDYPLFYDSDSNLFITQSYQRGIDFIGMSETGSGQILFNNDEAKAMVNELKGYHDAGILLTKDLNNGEYGSDYFKNGQCVFVVGSTGGTGYNDPGVSFNVGVCKFPAYTTSVGTEREKYVSQGVTLALLDHIGVNEETNNLKKELSWKLVKYLTNASNSITMCIASNGYVPARYSAYNNPAYAEYLESPDFMSICANMVINDIAGNYFNYPVFQGSDTARDAVGGIVTSVLRGSKTVDQAFSDAYNQTLLAL